MIDPFNAGVLGFVFFYLTFAFALTSSFSVFGLVFRLWFVKNQLAVKQVATALRQGIWFALLVIVSLILFSHSLLFWWNGLLLIAILAMLEFFFLSKDHRDHVSSFDSNGY
jgi:hypothetical protein